MARTAQLLRRCCPSEIFAISITIVPKLSAGTEKLQDIGSRIEILTTHYWP